MKNLTNRSGDRPLIFGHRGTPLIHQENTLVGFQEAINLGLDGVELDIFLSKDNQLVVFHDVNTERLTGVSENITALTWTEIQQLNVQASLNLGERIIINYGQPQKIPLLQDILAIAKHKLLVNIEIKTVPSIWRQYQTVTAVLRLLEKMDMRQQVFISSFDFWAIFWLRYFQTNLDYGLIFGKESPAWLEFSVIPPLLSTSLISLNLELFDAATIPQAHSRDLAIAAWTVFSRNALAHDSEKPLIRQLVQQKIDYLITDDPVKLQHFLDAL